MKNRQNILIDGLNEVRKEAKFSFLYQKCRPVQVHRNQSKLLPSLVQVGAARVVI